MTGGLLRCREQGPLRVAPAPHTLCPRPPGSQSATQKCCPVSPGTRVGQQELSPLNSCCPTRSTGAAQVQSPQAALKHLLAAHTSMASARMSGLSSAAISRSSCMMRRTLGARGLKAVAIVFRGACSGGLRRRCGSRESVSRLLGDQSLALRALQRTVTRNHMQYCHGWVAIRQEAAQNGAVLKPQVRSPSSLPCAPSSWIRCRKNDTQPWSGQRGSGSKAQKLAF